MLSLELLALLAAATQDTTSGGAVGARQEAAYRIEARMDAGSDSLRGMQELRYRNRSPDTLRVLVFELPLNARRGEPAARPPARRGFLRVLGSRIDAQAVAVTYPYTPDSSVLRVILPVPLAPGDSTMLTMEWISRAAARLGADLEQPDSRHIDFASWSPRVAVYDGHGWPDHPFDPDAESFGEIATFLVRLDVPADAVIGATGIPLCGSPGWARARRPQGGTVLWQRDWYSHPRDQLAQAIMDGDSACIATAPGRKTVVWYAEDVPDFALTINPGFRYEEGDFLKKPARVLYDSGQERGWGAGLVARRSETALGWLQEVAGLFPWPQTTTAQATSGEIGAPMVALGHGNGLETLVRLFGQNYFGGVVSTDAWRERWLGEGLNRFQTAWYFHEIGRRGDYARLERTVLGWDLDGFSQPVANPPGAFRDRATWLAMSSWRGELFFHQLRTASGGDGPAREILHLYYAAFTFRRADEQAFRQAAENITGRDQSTLFRQWLHETVLYDYAVGSVQRTEQPGDSGAGAWATSVEVVRKSPGQFPVDVWVIGASDTGVARASGVGVRERVTVTTTSQPREVRIDPLVLSHDWNMLNNRARFGFGLPGHPYLDTYLSRQSRRDALMIGLAPTAWYNSEGGWTFGVRSRSDYLGRFDLDEAYLNLSTGWGSDPEPGRTEINASLRLSNPTWLRSPGLTEWIGAAWVEGRVGAGLGMEKSVRRSLADSSVTSVGLSLEWLTVRTPSYLDPGFFSDAGTAELTATGRMTRRAGGWQFHGGATAAAGYMYPNAAAGPDVVEQVYFRGTLSGAARHPLGRRLGIGMRAYAGVALGGNDVVRQRLIYLAGSDPYEQFSDPFLRSRGSILRLDGVNYQSPGGANVRGLAPTVSASQAYGVNLELEGRVFQSAGGLLRRVSLATFADGALANGDVTTSTSGGLQAVADAGLGARVGLHVGQTSFEVRFDVPLWVSMPGLAQDTGPGDNAFGFRWTFSLAPVVP